MKRLLFILPIVFLLSWCMTDVEKYNKALEWCTMSWYTVAQSISPNWFNNTYNYYCVEIQPPQTRQDRFAICSNNCDEAIDDYRDASNISDSTINCLKLCMWE